MHTCDIKYIIANIKSSSFYKNYLLYKCAFFIAKYLYRFFSYVFYILREFQIIFFNINIRFSILKNYFLIEFTIMCFDYRILFKLLKIYMYSNEEKLCNYRGEIS